jgi:hypothetical protein
MAIEEHWLVNGTHYQKTLGKINSPVIAFIDIPWLVHFSLWCSTCYYTYSMRLYGVWSLKYVIFLLCMCMCVYVHVCVCVCRGVVQGDGQ